jgi:putative ABC transport system permease protein
MSIGFTKILRDLWLNRARTILVVLAIALSVMAYGVLNTTYTVVLHNFTAAFEQSEPAQAILVIPSFDEKLVEKVRRLPEVRLAEGRLQFNLTIDVDGKKRLINTYASTDPLNTRIARLAWEGTPPKELRKGEVLLDRTFKAILPVSPRESVTIQNMNGHSDDLTVSALPNDLNSIPARFNMLGQAFLNLDTAKDLDQGHDFNRLLVITNATGDDRAALQAEIQRQVTRIVDRVEDEGYTVLSVEVPVPHQPPLESVVRTLLLALQMFGFLIVVLAILVVSNVAAALIAEQTRQVGILKSLGYRSAGVLRLYSQMVLIIGSLALVIALPLVWILTRLLVNLLCGIIDAQLMDVTFPLSTWIVLPLLAFGATFVAVIFPLWRTSHLSVRQAISDESPRSAGGRAVLQSGSILVRNSLRVLLRKRQRLFLNLLMLGLAGGMFITALNVRHEVQVSVERVQLRRNYAIQGYLSELVGHEALEHAAESVPGVSDAQAVLKGSLGRVLPDGTQAGSIVVFAFPAGSDHVRPWLVSGQWPVHPKGLLISAEAAEMWGLTKQTSPGQILKVTAGGNEADDWVLEGEFGKLNMASAFAEYESYAKLTGQYGRANMLAVRLVPGADGQAVTDELLHTLEQKGMSFERLDYVPPLNAAEMVSYSIVVYILFVVVALTALVGGLGLLSNLGISVMERRREIGILRSMGSRPALIRRMVITEGLLTALLSLPLSYLLSWPLTLVLGKAVVTGITGLSPEPVYQLSAAFTWAVLVCSLALLSSWAPARQAGRLSIRETLIYQG